MQKILFSTILFISLPVLAQSQEASNFIVQSQATKTIKHSSNALKEMIGESARDVFKHSIKLAKQLGQAHVTLASTKNIDGLHRELGAWQVELASLQSHCSTIVEKLIENKKPFKKASKQELQDGYDAMHQAVLTLQQLEARFKAEHKKIDTYEQVLPVTLTNELLATVQKNTVQTKQVLSCFNSHACLKQS